MQQIIQHLFRVDSLEEVPRERLEELVSTYPSFGMGRYLLSRKLRTADAGHFSEEAQKTNLYFSNPFWLHWLLQNELEEQRPAYARSVPAAATIAAEESMVEEEQSWGMPDIAEETETVVVEPVVGEGETVTGVEPVTEPGEGFFQEKPTLVDEPGVTAELAGAAPEQATAALPVVTASVSQTAAEALLQSLEEARGLRQALVTMNEPGAEETPAEARFDQVPTGAGIEEPVSHLSKGAAIESALEDISMESRFEEASSGQSGEETVKAGLEEAPGGVVSIAESRAEEAGTGEASPAGTHSEAGPEVHTAPGTDTPEAREMETHSETGMIPESSVAAVVAQAAQTAQTLHTESGEPIVVFEPYHTIDYFASVGIKLVQDENPSDKLGKQLKSFTEWLKVMRKLPQKNQEIVSDGAVEHQIQAIAAHSITGKEILTETMAEVLVKQGMREKAMDVYHKLSLLNPDKSAYFASKIEQLKID